MSKRALIIGTSRGLGLGLTQELAARGWTVVATARHLASAMALQQLAVRQPSVTLDTADLDAPASLTALQTRLAGQVFDLVFINAGIKGPEHQSVNDTTLAEIGMLMITNAISPVRLAGMLVPQVKAQTGIVAFMTSRMGSVADNTSGGWDLYRASKAALNSLTRSFAVTAIGNRGITVLSVHPGWVRTDMGGAAAPLDVATSVAGIADVLEERAGSHTHAFVDYRGETVPW